MTEFVDQMAKAIAGKVAPIKKQMDAAFSINKGAGVEAATETADAIVNTVRERLAPIKTVMDEAFNSSQSAGIEAATETADLMVNVIRERLAPMRDIVSESLTPSQNAGLHTVVQSITDALGTIGNVGNAAKRAMDNAVLSVRELRNELKLLKADGENTMSVFGDKGDISQLANLVGRLSILSDTIADRVQKAEDAADRLADNGNSTVRQVQEKAETTAKAVKRAYAGAKVSAAELEERQKYINAMLDATARQYDVIKRKMESAQQSGMEESAIRLEKQYIACGEAMRKLEKEAYSMDDRIEQAKRNADSLGGEIKQANENMKKLAKNTDKASGGIKGMAKGLKNTAKNFLLFGVVMKASQMISQGLQDLVTRSEQANQVLSKYMSSFTYLQNALSSAILPILETFEPIVTFLVDRLADLLNYIGMFVAAVSGKDTYIKAKKYQVDYAASLNGTAEAAKKAKYALAGFDETNILSFGDEAEAIREVADAIEEVEVPEWLKNLAPFTGISKGDGGDHFDDTKPKKFADAVRDCVKEVEKYGRSLEDLKLPEWWRGRIPVPAFEKQKAPAIDTETEFEPSVRKYHVEIKAPQFETPTVPAIDTKTEFEPSKEKYHVKIKAPLFEVPTAPAIDTEPAFAPSESKYHVEIKAPLFEVPTAPAIDTKPLYEPSEEKYHVTVKAPQFEVPTVPAINMEALQKSLDLMKKNVQTTWDYNESVTDEGARGVSNTIYKCLAPSLDTVSSWGENVMGNTRTTFQYMMDTAPSGLNSVNETMSEFATTSSKGLANWGETTSKNMGTTVKSWVKTIGSGLSNAWEKIKNFFSAAGEKLTTWYDDNKSWVQPALGTMSLLAAGATIAMTGGTILAAVPALAGAGAIGALAAVPAFANGAVLKAPTLNIAGEYPGASRNPEIVTPQNIMYETVVEANRELVTAFMDIGSMIVNAINNKDTGVYLDGDEISQKVTEYQRRMVRIAGQ